MKTELKISEHSVLAGQAAVEVWHDGKFIATIYGSDGPGVRIFSRFDMGSWVIEGTPNLMEVGINVGS